MTRLAFASLLSLLLFPFSVLAESAAEISLPAPEKELVFVKTLEAGFQGLVNILETVLFFPIPIPGSDLGFPFLVAWLVIGGVFFTFYLSFANIRLLKHAVPVALGKYSSKDDPGEISHFQALSTSISGTVGLGNIAGVAVAVSLGGPGAVVWMMIAGVFGMATKFCEALLGHKFRKFDENGKVVAGAFHYLKDGLAAKGMPRVGRIMALIFATFCLGGAFGAGNMFQSNQTVAILTDTFDVAEMDWIIALCLAFAVGAVLFGGLKRIANVAEMIVPTMAAIYIGACIIVLVANASEIGNAVALMFSEAFNPTAVGGGLIGVIIQGFRRSVFSNEAGVGSASIVHPAARNTVPVRAGCTALLEAFVDTMIICFMTGLVITITGAYGDTEKTGIELASASFSTVIDWFPYVLSLCVFFFAFSTMITWSYYGEVAWKYLFGSKTVRFYQILFITVIFFGGSTDKFDLVINFSDLLFLSMALPNLIGLYLMSGTIKEEVSTYMKRLKAGEYKL